MTRHAVRWLVAFVTGAAAMGGAVVLYCTMRYLGEVNGVE